MAVSFVATSAVVEVSSGNISLDEAAGSSWGDTLVATLSYRGTPNFTLPAGWTLADPGQTSGNTTSGSTSALASLAVAYKFRGPAAETGVTFTRTGGDVCLGRMTTLRGVDPNNPIDSSYSETCATGTTVTSAGLTTSNANAFLFLAFATGRIGAYSAEKANTDPTSGWTERYDSNTATGADCSAALATATKSSASATGTFQTTFNAASTQTIVAVAFKPDPANPLFGAASDVAIGTGDLTTGAGGAALAGAAVDQATATGDLTTGIQLAGAAQDQTVATGALTTGIALAGQAADVAAGSGALSTQIKLAGAAADVATATGSLTAPGTGLSGSAVDQTSASGSLTTAIALAGAATDQASGSGALTTKIALSGAASDVATGSGTLGNAGGSITASDEMTRTAPLRTRTLVAIGRRRMLKGTVRRRNA